MPRPMPMPMLKLKLKLMLMLIPIPMSMCTDADCCRPQHCQAKIYDLFLSKIFFHLFFFLAAALVLRAVVHRYLFI